MRILFCFILLFLLVACHDRNYKYAPTFQQLFPDTTKTWAGERTNETYQQTRKKQTTFGLENLSEGTTGKEIRIWHLSGSYDPQVVEVIRQLPTGDCSTRIISFQSTNNDSILVDVKRQAKPGLLDSARVKQLWKLPSQSDMPDGDTYGCLDGGDLFIELADADYYKILWYRCPSITHTRNSTIMDAYLTSRYFRDSIFQRY